MILAILSTNHVHAVLECKCDAISWFFRAKASESVRTERSKLACMTSRKHYSPFALLPYMSLIVVYFNWQTRWRASKYVTRWRKSAPSSWATRTSRRCTSRTDACSSRGQGRQPSTASLNCRPSATTSWPWSFRASTSDRTPSRASASTMCKYVQIIRHEIIFAIFNEWFCLVQKRGQDLLGQVLRWNERTEVDGDLKRGGEDFGELVLAL